MFSSGSCEKAVTISQGSGWETVRILANWITEIPVWVHDVTWLCGIRGPGDFQAQSTRTPRDTGVSQRTFPSTDLHFRPCPECEQSLVYSSQAQQHLSQTEWTGRWLSVTSCCWHLIHVRWLKGLCFFLLFWVQESKRSWKMAMVPCTSFHRGRCIVPISTSQVYFVLIY